MKRRSGWLYLGIKVLEAEPQPAALNESGDHTKLLRRQGKPRVAFGICEGREREGMTSTGSNNSFEQQDARLHCEQAIVLSLSP